MRKQLIAFLLLLVMGAQFMAHFGYIEAQAKVIPKEAIRLRILANSDSEEDQALKRKVRDRVKEQIDTWVADLHSVDEARSIIRSRIPQLEQTVAKVLKEEHSKQTFQVQFGSNIPFPTKVYGNFIYPAGDYEAVLITLGNGEGANWWCVLFPPLCFLDFGTGTAVSKQVVEEPAAPVADEEQPKSPQEATVATLNEEPAQAKKEKPAVDNRGEQKKPIVNKEEKKTEVPEKTEGQVEATAKEEEQPVQVAEKKVEVKFFIVEMLQSLFSK